VKVLTSTLKHIIRLNSLKMQSVPHRKHVSATKTNRLMLFGETVAVYCENHEEHTNTVHTSLETHYGSATNTNRLTLFGETIAV
jgi:hypothetical protein